MALLEIEVLEGLDVLSNWNNILMLPHLFLFPLAYGLNLINAAVCPNLKKVYHIPKIYFSGL